ncbi:hypothetical protein J5N97_013296 [Dioscorea zingiberensis]|uniref:HTH myb-type domain-containing protein n=1 Tax=Dioscorea zingiberensis TaxID=325984 RepID=A0A9D5HIW8_9LILI|nr:hypothetical protein J5N97_013296 [Dioscorea zingiberensis]
MGSPTPELSLEYKPNSHAVLSQKPFADHDQLEHLPQRQLQDFLARLEEERLKIEAFKRELPLCMQLLNNAMEVYKQQLETYQTSQGVIMRPVLEEFIPLKSMSIHEIDVDKASDPSSEKSSWMVSAQLWSPANNNITKQELPLTAEPLKETEPTIFDSNHKLALDTKQRNGGAFLPFSKEKSKSPALVSPEREMDNGSKGCGEEQGKGSSTQTHRKARRCWSPDLHRRFVNALQILGGSQAATPKQIRELMKVDGLTNDEVKSHLQKYRLHTRRPMPVPQPPSAPPQLVVLGGIWVPPQYTTQPGPLHYCAPPMAQEFYHHHQQQQQQQHHLLQPSVERSSVTAYRGRLSSPESDGRSGGEQSESIEEEEVEEREEEEEEDLHTVEKKKVLVQVSSVAAECSGLKF